MRTSLGVTCNVNGNRSPGRDLINIAIVIIPI